MSGFSELCFHIAMDLCKKKIRESFNRKDGTDKSCDNGMRNAVEVPFAFFHIIMNLHFALFLAIRI